MLAITLGFIVANLLFAGFVVLMVYKDALDTGGRGPDRRSRR